MGYLVNIDNGGTFTDVCISDGERVVHAKAPTTPHDLTQCFVDVMLAASQQLYGEEDFGRLIHETDYLRYATTSGTNAVVERKGTPVALIVEKGEERVSIWRSRSPRAERTVAGDGARCGLQASRWTLRERSIRPSWHRW